MGEATKVVLGIPERAELFTAVKSAEDRARAKDGSGEVPPEEFRRTIRFVKDGAIIEETERTKLVMDQVNEQLSRAAIIGEYPAVMARRAIDLARRASARIGARVV